MVNTYWNMASASVRGFAHVHYKIVCQDKVKTAYINGVHVMALADGMGSCFLSDIGAQIAVDSACTFIAENFHALTTLSADKAIEDINSAVREALEEMANRLDVGLEDLASTLLVVAVCGNDTLAFHCGDGFIGLEKEDGTFKVVSEPYNTEGCKNITICMNEAFLEKMRIYKGITTGIKSLFIMSDGTSNRLYLEEGVMLPEGQEANSFDSNILSKITNCFKVGNETMACDLLTDILKEEIANYTNDDCSIAVMSVNN